MPPDRAATRPGWRTTLRAASRGRMEQPRVGRTPLSEATRLVADFSEADTMTAVTATGRANRAASLPARRRWTTLRVRRRRQPLSSTQFSTPRLSPLQAILVSRPSTGDVYRANQIVARFAPKDPRAGSRFEDARQDMALDQVELVGRRSGEPPRGQRQRHLVPGHWADGHGLPRGGEMKVEIPRRARDHWQGPEHGR